MAEIRGNDEGLLMSLTNLLKRMREVNKDSDVLFWCEIETADLDKMIRIIEEWQKSMKLALIYPDPNQKNQMIINGLELADQIAGEDSHVVDMSTIDNLKDVRDDDPNTWPSDA